MTRAKICTGWLAHLHRNTTPLTREQELAQIFKFETLCYEQADRNLRGQPPNRRRIAADFDRIPGSFDHELKIYRDLQEWAASDECRKLAKIVRREFAAGGIAEHFHEVVTVRVPALDRDAESPGHEAREARQGGRVK